MEINGNSHLRAGYFGALIKVRPTITAAHYNPGFCIGGMLTLSPVLRIQGAGAILAGLNVADRSGSKAALSIFLFDSALAATPVDHTTYTLGPDDSRLVQKISIVASDWVSAGSGSEMVAQISGGENYINNAENSNAFYAVVVAASGPTFISTSDLQFAFSFRLE